MKTNWPVIFIVSCLALKTLAADLILLGRPGDCALDRVTASDAKVSLGKLDGQPAWRVDTGHAQPWPGVTLKAPPGLWDLSAFASVTLKVRNAGASPVTVHCRVDNPGADGTSHCVTASLKLSSGKTATLTVPLTRTSPDKLEGKLFGMRGYPVKAGGPGTVDPREITQLVVFVAKPRANHAFEISDIRAAGRYVAPTAWTCDAEPFFPFIDTFGQYRHKDWPGKVKSIADLVSRREAESRELARESGPKGWDKYGGWGAGPQLKATGFFRTEKLKNKWWLVDPAGRLFFSHGIDSVLRTQATPIDERENWFEDFPGNQGEFAKFLRPEYALKGHYQGKTPQCFAFDGANLARKYGPDWKQISAGIVHQRLRSWGINTIGNWSDETVCRMDRTPYTDTIGTGRTVMIEGSEGYWGKFPDVFDPGFAESLRRSMAAKKGRSAGDPWCIGYFSDNEMSWGDEVSLAVAVLKSPPSQAAKQQFVSDLKAKYGPGNSAAGQPAETGIARLNQAWGTSYASWDDLMESRQAPDRRKARADLTAFYTKIAEQYFRVVREAIKAVAPNQLYLGCRFAWVNDRAAAAAARYCDVVSYNLYRRSVAEFAFNGGADVPLLIGEFHFGALDRGLFHTGLVPVASQEARAKAYEEYVLGALHHPQFVGCHWFKYCDEPTTGRTYDEENYQIGFVDVADTPYQEIIQASRKVAEQLYR